MDSLDYKKLYALQDEVLGIVFAQEQIFYLTGGTCLSRFYQEKRYSDDLDFFTHDAARFSFAVKNIKAKLLEVFDLNVQVETKDFIRFEVEGLLQLDFINDRVPRYKEVVVLESGYIIDTVENILSNKLTAVIGRDDPKDVFDIYLIAKFYDFDWKTILEASHTKAIFDDVDLIVRLKSFPRILLKSINMTDKNFLNHFADEFTLLIEEINSKQMHTAITTP